MCTTQHGRPHSVIRDDQPDAREGQAGRRWETERLVVPLKPGIQRSKLFSGAERFRHVFPRRIPTREAPFRCRVTGEGVIQCSAFGRESAFQLGFERIRRFIRGRELTQPLGRPSLAISNKPPDSRIRPHDSIIYYCAPAVAHRRPYRGLFRHIGHFEKISR
jgi:hypothetical protein